MEVGFPFLDSLFNILIVVAVIPALWVAGRIVLRNSMIERISVRLFLWFVLGGFFLIPLVGLVSLVRNLLSMALSGQTAPGISGSAIPGLSAPAVYSALDAAIWLFGYGVGWAYGRRLIRDYGAQTIKALSLTPLEQDFAVLGLAGLFMKMLSGFTTYSWPVFAGLMSENPLSAVLIGGIGFLMLAVAALVMKARLRGA